MSIRVTIHGEAEAERLGLRLDQAGRGRLTDMLKDAVEDANDDVPRKLRASAITTLPKRGGLGQEVARSRIRKRNISAGLTAGVLVTASHEYEIEGMDQGRNVHPTFGRRPWFDQAVRPGWFTRVVEQQRPINRTAIVRAVEKFAATL